MNQPENEEILIVQSRNTRPQARHNQTTHKSEREPTELKKRKNKTFREMRKS